MSSSLDKSVSMHKKIESYHRVLNKCLYLCTRQKCINAQKNRVMEIKRDIHLNRIIARKGNGMIKVITGMRRCGKSYLLFTLFYNYLKEHGIDDAHIIKVDLEDRRNAALRNPDALLQYIDSRMTDSLPFHSFG